MTLKIESIKTINKEWDIINSKLFKLISNGSGKTALASYEFIDAHILLIRLQNINKSIKKLTNEYLGVIMVRITQTEAEQLTLDDINNDIYQLYESIITFYLLI